MPLETPPRVQITERSTGGDDTQRDLNQLKAFSVATSQYMTTLYNRCRGPVLAREAVLPLAALDQTISASPTQAEVEAIQEKVNEILEALQTPINTGQ